jgi:hypothetical protein
MVYTNIVAKNINMFTKIKSAFGARIRLMRQAEKQGLKVLRCQLKEVKG